MNWMNLPSPQPRPHNSGLIITAVGAIDLVRGSMFGLVVLVAGLILFGEGLRRVSKSR